MDEVEARFVEETLPGGLVRLGAQKFKIGACSLSSFTRELNLKARVEEVIALAGEEPVVILDDVAVKVESGGL